MKRAGNGVSDLYLKKSIFVDKFIPIKKKFISIMFKKAYKIRIIAAKTP